MTFARSSLFVLALMSPIAIDRRRGHSALRFMAKRGTQRLAQGFWVVVFPEGTRVAPGEQRAYQIGGAWLAAASGAPVVPVAHNAGLLWPRYAFLKHPGTITVRIGHESPYQQFTSTSVVATGYGLGDEAMGNLGVVGPTRMDYPGTMAAVRAVARYVSRILDEA